MSTSHPSPFRSPHLALHLLVVLGSVIALGFHTSLWSANPLNHHIEGLVIVWAGFLGSLFLYKSEALGHRLLCGASLESRFLIWAIILFFAVVFRAQVLLAEPFLADDYQRYLFDGKLIIAGINPYATVPLSFPELGGADIPKPEVKTIYPPLAEGLFAVASWLGGSLWHWRLLNLIPDLLGATVFWGLLRIHKLPDSWIVLWLWNPLILKEGLHAAHLDIWTLLAVLLFVYSAQQKCLKIAALSLGAAVLLKLIPLLLLPAWLTQLPSHRERLVVAGIVSGVLFGGFFWFLPSHPFGNLTVFLQHIEGYGALFQLFQQGIGALDIPVDVEWSKWLLTSLGGALYLHWVFVVKRYSHQSPLHLLELFLLFYVFSSMGFPWYLLPILPWLLIHSHWLWIVFIALSQLVFYAGQLHLPSTAITGITLIVMLMAALQQNGQLKTSTEGK